VDEVGLLELRQHASDLVRRAQSGERLTITVSGRPAAVLGPLTGGPWKRWVDVADVFAIPAAADGDGDRDLIGNSVRDPWNR
jgi:prevent-host-death family protein